MNASTVYVSNGYPKDCHFNFSKVVVEEGAEGDEIVEVAFAMDKCGGTYERVSLRNYASITPQNLKLGIYMATLFTITYKCALLSTGTTA